MFARPRSLTPPVAWIRCEALELEEGWESTSGTSEAPGSKPPRGLSSANTKIARIHFQFTKVTLTPRFVPRSPIELERAEFPAEVGQLSVRGWRVAPPAAGRAGGVWIGGELFLP